MSIPFKRFNETVSITNNTSNSTLTNGALIVAGGAGISGNLSIGGQTNYFGANINSVSIQAPLSNPSSSFSLKLPNSLPLLSNSYIISDTSGNISFASSITNTYTNNTVNVNTFTITGLSGLSGTITVTTSAPHNFISNQTVYITGTNTVPSINNQSYIVTFVSSTEFTIQASISSTGSIAGNVYSTSIGFTPTTGFDMIFQVSIPGTTSLTQLYRLIAINSGGTGGSGWNLSVVSVAGDEAGILFAIHPSSGLMYYMGTNTNYTGATSITISWTTYQSTLSGINITGGTNTTGTPSLGNFLTINGATYTDSNTVASGTLALWTGSYIGTPTLNATNTSVTTSIASTLYIQGAPIVGTNQSMPNRYALYINDGNTYIGNDLVFNGNNTHLVSLRAISGATYTLTLPTTAPSVSQVLVTDGSGQLSWGANNATGITNVSMTVPTFLSVTPATINGSGQTFAVTLSGTALPVANGGTGLGTITNNAVLIGNGTGNISASSNLSYAGSVLSVTGSISLPTLTGNTLTISSTATSVTLNANSFFTAGGIGVTLASYFNSAVSIAVTTGTNLALSNTSTTSQLPLTVFQPSLAALTATITVIPTGSAGNITITATNSFTAGYVTIINSNSIPSINGTWLISSVTGTNFIINVPFNIIVAGTTGTVTASNTQTQIGVSGTANNSGVLSYYHNASANATNNLVQLGVFGSIYPISVNGNGLCTMNISAMNVLAPVVTSTTSSAGTLTLTVFSSTTQVITGTNSHTIVLPSATTLVNGVQYKFINQSISPITIQRNGGIILTLLQVNSSIKVTLTNNTTVAGIWGILGGNTVGQRISASGYLYNSFTAGANNINTDLRVLSKRIRSSRGTVARGLGTFSVTTTTLPSLTWSSICWSPELNIFVIGHASAVSLTTMVSSTDGVTWTTNTVSGGIGYYNSICWSPENGRFVAVSSNNGITSTTNIMHSTNGTTWTQLTGLTSNFLNSVCWSPENALFVAVGGDATNGYTATSPDGLTWTITTSTTTGTTPLSATSICWSPELLIFIVTNGANSNGIYYSTANIPTATSWTPASQSGSGITFSSVTWSPELYLFVAVGSSSITNVYTSSNGINWTVRNTGQSAMNSRQIIWSQELSVFVVSGTNGIWTSNDGLTWVTRNTGNALRCIEWSRELSEIVTPISDTSNILSTSNILQSISSFIYPVIVNSSVINSSSLATLLSPSLNPSNNNSITLGVSSSVAYNSGVIQFNYVNSGNTTNTLGFGFTGATNLMGLNGIGTLTVTGDIIAFGSLSDKRLKTNINDINTQEAKKVIKNLRPVTFNWKDTAFNRKGEFDSGFIAQEMETILPHTVGEYIHPDTNETYKNIRHERLVPYLLTVIQEMMKDIEELKTKIKN